MVVSMSPYSTRLLATMHELLEPWMHALVDRVVTSQDLSARIDRERLDRVVHDSARSLIDDLTELFAHEAWEQRRNPLELLREATGVLTVELTALGAQPVVRDEFKERSFPSDVFDLAPATWSDVHPDLHEVGLEWGAWKAAAIISRRRSLEGRSS